MPRSRRPCSFVVQLFHAIGRIEKSEPASLHSGARHLDSGPVLPRLHVKESPHRATDRTFCVMSRTSMQVETSILIKSGGGNKYTRVTNNAISKREGVINQRKICDSIGKNGLMAAAPF